MYIHIVHTYNRYKINKMNTIKELEAMGIKKRSFFECGKLQALKDVLELIDEFIKTKHITGNGKVWFKELKARISGK